MNEGESPPLSARLRELSNNLKSLYTSTPLHIKIPHETHTPFDSLVVSADIVEPKTPVTEQNLIVKDKWEVAHCPSGLKVKLLPYFLYDVLLILTVLLQG